MDTQYNSSTGKKTWLIDTWYEKIIYIAGIFFSFIVIGSFLFGFFQELTK